MSSNFGGNKDSFSITLVSSASIQHSDNSLAVFKNLLSEDINRQGEWRVALTEITFPTHFNNVTDTKIVYYKKDKIEASIIVAKNKIPRTYDGEKTKVTKVEYEEIEKLFTKSIGRLILIISVFASTPLPNIFQCGRIIGKALSLGAHEFLELQFSKV